MPELLRRASREPLKPDDAKLLAAAIRKHEPWLEWSGKREKLWFEVEPVALHIHGRVSTQSIVRVLAREDVQRDVFADRQRSYTQAVQFYQKELVGEGFHDQRHARFASDHGLLPVGLQRASKSANNVNPVEVIND